MLRVGHKGADGIIPGNSIESFHAAVEVGVDAIEFDVLRPPEDFADGSDWRTAPAGPAPGGGPILVAHDWGAARRAKEPLTLDQALDAFTKPPLDQVKIDLDIKIKGREDEIVEAVRSRGLSERTMTSGTEIPTIRILGEIAPELSRGWTIPRVTRDWTKSRIGKPLVLAGMATLPRPPAAPGQAGGTAARRRIDLGPPRPRHSRARQGRARLRLHPRRLDRGRRGADARARRNGRRRHLHERSTPLRPTRGIMGLWTKH